MKQHSEVVRIVRGTGILALVLVAGTAWADPYDPPANYYNSVTGTGATLKSTLRTAMGVGFISRNYGDARYGLPVVDRDPNNASNVILVYTGVSVPSVWDSGITWNREHTWPESYGNTSTSAPQYSDLHMLRPCNMSVNSSRGNKPFGLDAGLWDPTLGGSPIQYRGEMARAIFYAATRYGDPAGSTTTGNFVIVDSGWGSGISKMGKLSYLLQWHYDYPVDTRERKRNQTVFDQSLNPTYYQNNRNGYVDHPEYIWAIWGTQPNDSTLYVGGSPAGDGSSSVNADFGQVITGAPAFGTQNVTLSKSGATPTTFDISVAGNATCAQAGPRQAFSYSAATRSLTVGVSTSGIGAYSGTITVDNTDLTSNGSGQGVADGNDTINVSAVILDHASPSLASSATMLSQTIDFGTVNGNSGVHTMPVSIFNRASTPGLTAWLDVNSVSGVGTPVASLGVIGTTLAPVSGIGEGGAEAGQVSLDSSQAPGSYQVVYTIASSDESLPGAIARPSLTLTVVGTIVAACPGDLNGDQVVDDLDFVLFAAAYDLFDCTDPSMPAGCPSDLNGDLVVEDSDFVLFASAYDAFLCP
ncbi:MAG: endonuclease [Phycisphaeraceae bacterium]|nr:endonuclease [Phycisphaeraceae bacterium]